jgi:hypothetical protein
MAAATEVLALDDFHEQLADFDNVFSANYGRQYACGRQIQGGQLI